MVYQNVLIGNDSCQNNWDIFMNGFIDLIKKYDKDNILEIIL